MMIVGWPLLDHQGLEQAEEERPGALQQGQRDEHGRLLRPYSTLAFTTFG
jgi:hypothetical protein